MLRTQFPVFCKSNLGVDSGVDVLAIELTHPPHLLLQWMPGRQTTNGSDFKECVGDGVFQERITVVRPAFQQWLHCFHVTDSAECHRGQSTELRIVVVEELDE